jgi:hypothetical protein
MIIIPKGNLWLVATTTIKCLLAYEKNFSIVDLDVLPYL